MGFFNFKKDSEEETREKELYYDLWRATPSNAGDLVSALSQILHVYCPDSADKAHSSGVILREFYQDLALFDSRVLSRHDTLQQVERTRFGEKDWYFAMADNLKIELHDNIYLNEKLMITSTTSGHFLNVFLIGSDGLVPVYDVEMWAKSSLYEDYYSLTEYGIKAIKRLEYNIYRKGNWTDYVLNELVEERKKKQKKLTEMRFSDVNDDELFVSGDRYICNLIISLCRLSPKVAPETLPGFWQGFLSRVINSSSNTLLWRGLVIETSYVLVLEDNRFFVVYDMSSEDASIKTTMVYAVEADKDSIDYDDFDDDVKPLFNYIIMKSPGQSMTQCPYKDPNPTWVEDLKQRVTHLKEKAAV